MPFDERYLKVPYEYMEFSFLRYLSSASYDDRRRAYLKHVADIEEAKKKEADFLAQDENLEKNLGYSDPEERKQILEILKKQAGLG
jgi:hypothetical protein